jgi:uncharacterized repeat protein (TIGR01451 family)
MLVVVAAACAALGSLMDLPFAGAQSSGCGDFFCADISVTKSDSPDPVYVGDNITYTIVVANNGRDVPNSVDLTDNLPNSVGFVSVDTTTGTCNESGGNVSCSFGRMCSPSASECSAPTGATVTLVVQALRAGSVTNTAHATSDATDPDTSNNRATAITTVKSPFELTLSPASATNRVGSQHTVTATLTFKGQPDPGRQINFTATGANQASGSDTTDSAGHATFTYTGGNAGTDTITACYPNSDGACLASDTATKTWTGYQIDLGGTTPGPGTIGVAHTVVAHVTNDGQDVNGLQVLFSVSGSNTAFGSDVTGPNTAKAEFTYTGTNEGADTDVACLDLNGNDGCDSGEPTASIAYTWKAQCENGKDDDGDGLTDWPNDPGCSAAGDTTEFEPGGCRDHLDNDHDGAIDYPQDPGCASRDDPTEIFDNPDITPGGGGDSGSAGQSEVVSPPGGVVVVVPAHAVSHARFRVAYGRIVRAHHSRHLMIRLTSRRTQRVRLRIKLRYSATRVVSVTRTVWSNTRVNVTGLSLDGVHSVRLTVLG